MPCIELRFPFRYRNPLTGEWVCAQQNAQLHEIAQLHEAYEITGPPDFREVPTAELFQPIHG